jgi:hypothetical protein
MPRSKKASYAEVDHRIESVAVLLLGGARRSEIMAHADRQGWGVVPRQVDVYIRRAHEQIAQQGAADLKSERAVARARLEMIFRATMGSKDHARALATVREIVNLLGLAAPPPPRTLNLNVDTVQLQTLIECIEGAGLSAGDVFAAMIEQLATAPTYAMDDLSDGYEDGEVEND